MNSKKRWGHGLISLVVILALFIPLFPSTVGADPVDSGEQIVVFGGINYYDSNGKEAAGSPVIGKDGVVVSVNKTIQGTDKENEFLIDLEVKTSADISNIVSSPDAAAVLVLDTSSSMANHIADLKAAAISFLDAFANVDRNTTARYVALVTYASDAEIKYGWVDITNSDRMSELRSTINALETEGGTFIQGGLLLARNLLRTEIVPKGKDGKTIGNRSVILFSSGAATHSSSLNFVNNGRGKTDNDTAGYEKGTRIGYGKKKGDGNGQPDQSPSVLMTIKDRTKNMADMVRSANSFTVEDNSGKGKSPTYTKLDAKLYTIAYGDEADAIWLRENIADKESFGLVSKDADTFNKAFSTITASIERWAKAWVVTDPMGPNIEFIQTIDNDESNGIPAFDESTKTLEWDLRKSNPVPDENNIFAYKCSYRIKLDNTVSGFLHDEPYETNGETVLDYVMVDNNQTEGEVLKAKFRVPQVKGYLSNFNFTKVDSDGLQLPGCVFQLDYADDNKKGLFDTAASDTNGIVAFSNIPSGYTYTLKESSLPDSLKDLYRLNDETLTVTVSMRNLIISDSSGAIINNFRFVNQKKKVDFSFQIIDGIIFAADNKVIALSEAEFKVYKSIPPSENKYIPMIDGKPSDSDWEQHWQQYGDTVTSDANGNVTLSMEPGDYMLVETKAPTYNAVQYTLPAGQWALKVDNAGVALPVVVTDNNGQLAPAFISGRNNEYMLPNFRTQDLPLTGGTGIATFIGIGSLVLVFGTVLFVIYQQRNRNCSGRIAIRK